VAHRDANARPSAKPGRPRGPRGAQSGVPRTAARFGCERGLRDGYPFPIVRMVKLTRCGGQVDYAAIAATCAFNSNSIGLT